MIVARPHRSWDSLSDRRRQLADSGVDNWRTLRRSGNIFRTILRSGLPLAGRYRMINRMETSAIKPSAVPEAIGGYVNVLDVRGAQRMLFVSGQIPQDRPARMLMRE